MREGQEATRTFARQLRKRMPRAEALLWSYVRKRALDGAKFRRQHPIGPYIADFACIAAKLVVEVDGATHSAPEELAHDAKRTKYLEANGWRVLRIANTDVFEDMNGVWLAIAAHLPPPAASRPPPPHAGEE